MTKEIHTCQNCKTAFTIEPEDFAFYEKIHVPPPRCCPECRQKRRYAWRNERVLYRRNCDMCHKSTVTIYSPNKPYKVYCPSCWWSDKWNGTDYGRDFDFSKSFFPQWQELQLQVPRIALLTKNSVNSEYTNHCNNNKNCYLSFCIFDSENILYSTNMWKNAKDCCDCTMIPKGGELLYGCIDSDNCYRCQYGLQLRNCTDCYYCYDCRGCTDCFLSSNLRNKKYCFANQPCTKEAYTKRVQEWNLGSFAHRQKLSEQFMHVAKTKAVHRASIIEKSINATGNMILNSKNTVRSFDAYDMENAKYVTLCLTSKDTMDSYHYGFNSEMVYESHALIHDYDVLFTHLSYDNAHLQYCDGCHNSQNLFGCVGVKQGQCGIFNKLYSESDYADLKNKIIEHMKRTGEYGEFFPPELSPFGYNETQGQIYMPMEKESALRNGLKWEDCVPGTFDKETIQPADIPDNIQDVPDDITKEILSCTRCSKNYNIVADELSFYRKECIPIPRLCPDCRYRDRISLRLPRKLWRRCCQCAGVASQNGVYKNIASHRHGITPCQEEFETSYAPDRPEIVYCESCYTSEVV